jgi:AcrR family transcriptional regulator
MTQAVPEDSPRRRLPPTERRRELLAATRIVLERHGYSGASVPRVVDAAGTAQGNFYRHFDNLDDAVLVLAREVLTPIAEAADRLDFSHAATADEVEEVLSAFYRQLAVLLSSHASLLREILLVGQAAKGPVGEEVTAFLSRMRARAAAVLDEHARRPPFRPDMDSQIVAGAIVGMVVGAVQDVVLWGQAFDPKAWENEMAAFETGALVARTPERHRGGSSA